MKTINEKILELAQDRADDSASPHTSYYDVIAGAELALPLAKAEGFMLAIEFACALDMQGLASELEDEGIRLGLLPADKKEKE